MMGQYLEIKGDNPGPCCSNGWATLIRMFFFTLPPWRMRRSAAGAGHRADQTRQAPGRRHPDVRGCRSIAPTILAGLIAIGHRGGQSASERGSRPKPRSAAANRWCSAPGGLVTRGPSPRKRCSTQPRQCLWRSPGAGFPTRANVRPRLSIFRPALFGVSEAPEPARRRDRRIEPREIGFRGHA